MLVLEIYSTYDISKGKREKFHSQFKWVWHMLILHIYYIQIVTLLTHLWTILKQIANFK